MRLYIYKSFIKRLPLRLNEYPNTVNGETPVSLNTVGPTCYSQCDIVVFFDTFLPISLSCLFSNETLLLYLPIFSSCFLYFVLLITSLLFLCWGMMFNSTRHSLFCSHSSCYYYCDYSVHHFFMSITQLLIPQVHCAFTCNLVVHWGFSFLFFLY